MKKTIKLNILVSVAFFLLNIISLLIEKHVQESTAETLGILLFLFLLAALIWINKSALATIHNKTGRALARVSLVSALFTGLWAMVYFFNWHIFIPILYR